MSILLDALKRSESQRDLGRVPTLQTATDTGGHEARQPPAWLPAVMVMLAAGLIGWMVLQQFRLPDGWEESRPAAHPGAEAYTGSDEPLSVSAQSAESSAGANAGDTAGTAEPRSILPRIPPANPASPSAPPPEAAGQRRLGREVRDYAADEQLATANELPVEASAAVMAQSPGSTSSRAGPTLDNAERQAGLAQVEVAQVPRAGPAAEPRPAEVYEPEIINYWQVPEKMREGLPDLRISVLVFAEQPENRFLLLNGERLREGQQLENGLLLEEIRRDRAIFNYRNYRFFLKS